VAAVALLAIALAAWLTLKYRKQRGRSVGVKGAKEHDAADSAILTDAQKLQWRTYTAAQELDASQSLPAELSARGERPAEMSADWGRTELP
jgi:hypothetical protein